MVKAMGKDAVDCETPFLLEGRFLGFSAQGGHKFKYLRLLTANGEYFIKTEKELRLSLWRDLPINSWIQVIGHQKYSNKINGYKFKAHHVFTAFENSFQQVTQQVPVANVEAPPESISDRPCRTSTILVCNKSDCCKRGSSKVIATLNQEIRDRGLEDQVTVRATGCMKRCKSAPNLVMPDKMKHERVKPEAVKAILDKYLSQQRSGKPSRDEAIVLVEYPIAIGQVYSHSYGS